MGSESKASSMDCGFSGLKWSNLEVAFRRQGGELLGLGIKIVYLQFPSERLGVGAVEGLCF